MRKIYLFFVLYIIFSFNNSGTTVYVCSGKYAKKYHYSTGCRGLNNCKAEIVKTTLDQVVSSGKTLCGFEQ